MSATSDATNIAALSNALNNGLKASTPNIAQCIGLSNKLCLALTHALTAYAGDVGIDPGDIPTIVQGGGTPKSPA